MNALVIGGTGPTGPYIVEGLCKKGYDVGVLHRGLHEVEYSQPVEHIHVDPFSPEAVESLGSRKFDVVVSMYGRLRQIAEGMKGRTPRFLGVTGVPAYLGSINAADNPEGLLMPVPENAPLINGPEISKIGYLIVVSEQEVMRIHEQGGYSATLFRYPLIYGPRQLPPKEWSIIRRVLDKRTKLILPDDGLVLRSRAYAENAAHALLLAIDHPESGGQIYNVAEERTLTLRQWVEAIAGEMGHQFEYIDLPWALAKPSYMWATSERHLVLDNTRIKKELGYRDVVPTKEGLKRTVQWFLEHRPEPGGEIEQQLRDPFQYDIEDKIIQEWEKTSSKIRKIPFVLEEFKYSYADPRVS
ncbi:MAG: NAD-dependent epimerase/dehydratase family protein [Dehalococcoidales bacterium]